MRVLFFLFSLISINTAAQEGSAFEKVHQINRVFLCFDKKGLEDTLDLVKTPPWQYINESYNYRESKTFNKNQCTLGFIAEGSSAEMIGFYRSNKRDPPERASKENAEKSSRDPSSKFPKESSIFSIYKVALPNGLIVYAANTIYAPQYWTVRRGHDCGHEDSERSCIVPTSCAALDANSAPTFVSKFQANEFKIPQDCNVPKLRF